MLLFFSLTTLSAQMCSSTFSINSKSSPEKLIYCFLYLFLGPASCWTRLSQSFWIFVYCSNRVSTWLSWFKVVSAYVLHFLKVRPALLTLSTIAIVDFFSVARFTEASLKWATYFCCCQQATSTTSSKTTRHFMAIVLWAIASLWFSQELNDCISNRIEERLRVHAPPASPVAAI